MIATWFLSQWHCGHCKHCFLLSKDIGLNSVHIHSEYCPVVDYPKGMKDFVLSQKWCQICSSHFPHVFSGTQAVSTEREGHIVPLFQRYFVQVNIAVTAPVFSFESGWVSIQPLALGSFSHSWRTKGLNFSEEGHLWKWLSDSHSETLESLRMKLGISRGWWLEMLKTISKLFMGKYKHIIQSLIRWA